MNSNKNLKLEYNFIDLTHVLGPSISTWSGDCGFHHQVTLDYGACTSDTKFRVQKVSMDAGIGTHMDAPAHCIRGGKSIADLSLDQLIAPCVVIDVTQDCDAHYALSVEEVIQFERK